MKLRLPKLYTVDSSLKEVPVNLTKWIVILLIFLSVFIFCTAFYFKKQVADIEYIQSEVTVDISHNEKFSKDSLISLIKELPFSYPDITLAQCIYESGHFSSPVWKENKNCLGMRHPLGRKTLSLGSNIGYAVFKNWKQCLYDKAIYDALYMHGLSRQQYMKYLDKVYARSEGEKYSEEIEKIIRQNNLKTIWN